MDNRLIKSVIDSRRKNNNTKYQGYNLSPSPFLVEWGKNKKFIIKTYGCQANVRDSEIIKAFLLKIGMTECNSFDKADFVLFNTCAVRENAENHLYGELGLVKRRLRTNKDLVVGICGCVMQESKPVEFILEHFKFVKLIFGTSNIPSFYLMLEKAVKEKSLAIDLENNFDLVYEEKEDINISRSSKFIAYTNIMYGCDKFCSYCIVPYTRGKERSRKKEDILNEISCLKKLGYKQVTLLGQNVDSYGKDFNNGYTFSSLLEDVAKIGIERIRFTTPYPSDFDEKTFSIMKKYPNIMPSIHMPLQSGSNDVLKKMNRRYTKEEYLDLIYSLKKHIPNIFITTDIIVGFPSESEKDFLETLDVVNKVQFDQAFTFIYSKRESTPASKMKNVSSDKEIKNRFITLKKLVDDIAERKSNEMIGKTCNVLFESVSKKNKENYSGYNEYGKLVHVKGDDSLIGKIKKVRITESHTYSLLGEIINE